MLPKKPLIAWSVPERGLLGVEPLSALASATSAAPPAGEAPGMTLNPVETGVACGVKYELAAGWASDCAVCVCQADS